MIEKERFGGSGKGGDRGEEDLAGSRGGGRRLHGVGSITQINGSSAWISHLDVYREGAVLRSWRRKSPRPGFRGATGQPG